MDKAKGKSQTKSKSRLRTLSDGMPKLIHPLILPPSLRRQAKESMPVVGNITPRRRPVAEIISELRRLRASPLRIDDESDSWSPPLARPVRTLEQLEQLRLSRHRLEQLLLRPAFDQAVSNCFVRVHVNAEATDEMPDYRIAEVLGTTELPEGYYVNSPEIPEAGIRGGGGNNNNNNNHNNNNDISKSIPTNVALRLRYDDMIKEHELNDISNMPFNRPEFELWRDNCINQAIEPPTTETISRKKIELYNALNSEAKSIATIQQSWTLPIRLPHRGDLLERHGGIYPWQLQRPLLPITPLATVETVQLPLSISSSSINILPSENQPTNQLQEPEIEIEIEAINEELEAQRSLTRLHSSGISNRVRRLH